ncbi:unnamed protein product [Thelazia callipaeda]|uniref:WD_REPEATS_REGION domain-containing protein n=1 Tax=Thelazia callipaeda TaxID=103827 RepID=A0A0N5CVH3_THECL|nr:unnamed protein product [Thelazia callipaeda]
MPRSGHIVSDLHYHQKGHRMSQALPDSYFLNYASDNCHISSNAWVACQFSNELCFEHFLAIGDENGYIHVLDVREDVISNSFAADRSCVIDVAFVPNFPNLLLSISGHAKVASWDIERKKLLQLFTGHEGSVRALTVFSNNPNLFATGARDGTICIWDRRDSHIHSSRPYNVLEATHPLLSSPNHNFGIKRRSQLPLSTNSKGVTSLIHHDGYTLISASSSFKTGIRFWDLRYRGKTTPFRILGDSNNTSSRDFGIASLCLDRFNSLLFAASTDSKIYEYSIQGSKDSPVNILQGIKRPPFNTYDFKIAASPLSDHVMFGSGDCFAAIWDLQERYTTYSSGRLNYLPYPKYTLGGHRFEVTVAKFSCTARYISTMDDSYLKIWKWKEKNIDNEELSPLSIHHDRVELYELPETFIAENSMKVLNVSPSTSQKNLKRSPFKSPFKSPLNHLSPSSKTESGSPVKKIFRADESPPLRDLTNKSSQVSQQLDSSESDDKKKPAICAFHYKYPTMHLPNSVKDRINALKKNSTIITSDAEGSSTSSLNPDHKALKAIKSPAISDTLSQGCSHSRNSSLFSSQVTSERNKKISVQRTIDHYFSKIPKTS